MNLLLLADFFLAGNWKAPAAGSSIQDAYGVTITVGSYVKFVGRVTAINPSDPHYGEIQVTPVHPASLFIPDAHYGSPQSPNFQPGNPQNSQVLGFSPQQLIVGV